MKAWRSHRDKDGGWWIRVLVCGSRDSWNIARTQEKINIFPPHHDLDTFNY